MATKKNILWCIFMLFLTACGTKQQQVEMKKPIFERRDIGEFTPNTLIIMYDKDVGKEPLVEAVKAHGAEIIYDYNIIPSFAIRIPDSKKINNSIQYFKKVKGVLSVERDRIYHIDDPIGPRGKIKKMPFNPSVIQQDNSDKK